MGVDSRQVGEAENFVRKNEKYFVKPEDVMLVKLLISRHVPLDIFGRKVFNCSCSACVLKVFLFR